MDQSDQHHQVPVAQPPPLASYPPLGAEGHNGPHIMAPPPMGYPTKDGDSQGCVPVQTTSRGKGFWKGCVAAVCCCWCLEICC